MVFAPELRTHAQRVCKLYKHAMRTIEAYYHVRYIVRYHQVLLRAQFDENKCICDHKEMRRKLWLGEHELFMKQPGIPCMKFPMTIWYLGADDGVRRWIVELFYNFIHAKRMVNFPRSYGLAAGVAIERVVSPPDWVLDYWHPLEKAMYPEYFSRRECRKCEYIEKWRNNELC